VNTVRDYLIEKGIKAERITVIGYGRTKPALFEASPGDINSPEAKTNMRFFLRLLRENLSGSGSQELSGPRASCFLQL
jgi:hypothetical protein